MALPSQGGCPCKALAERGSRGETRRGPTLSAAEPPPPLPAAAWPPLLGGRWNQGWQTQVLVCIVVSGVCFLSFENFPWLVGGPPGATSRRDCDGRRRCDEEADGAPGVSVPAHPVPRILVCMGRREEMGQVPSAWNALPPLLHLANSYSSVKTQHKRPLLQEAFPDFSGSASVPPVSCAPFSVPAASVRSLGVAFRVCRPSRL